MLNLIRKLFGLGNVVEDLSQETLGIIDVRIDENCQDLLNWILKEKIERVYYLTANYKEKENYSDQYHLIDVGLILELSNSKWLNWVWVEEGYNGDSEYNISKIDILGRFHKMCYRKEDVSDSIKWKALIGENITDVRFQFEEIEGRTYLSEMRLVLADRKITVNSIEEPEENQEIDIMDLDFSPEWSIIVFDD